MSSVWILAGKEKKLGLCNFACMVHTRVKNSSGLLFPILEDKILASLEHMCTYACKNMKAHVCFMSS